MATNAELRELLDERFAAHEAKSKAALELHDAHLRSHLDTVKADIIAAIAKHDTAIQLHDRRISDLEDRSKGWRSWALGILGALVVAVVQLFVRK